MYIIKLIQDVFKRPSKETNSISLIIERTIEEYTSKNQYYWWLKGKDFQTFNQKVLPLTDKEKVSFILHCIQTIYKYYNQSNYLASRNDFMRAWVCEIYMDQLLKLHLQLDDDDISQIIVEFKKHPRQSWNQHITCWPVDLLMNQIEYQLTLRPCSASLKQSLVLLNNEILKEATSSQQKQQKNIFQKLYELQFKLNNTGDIVQSGYFYIDDDFVKYTSQLVKDLDEQEHTAWFKIMYHAENSHLEKPSSEFISKSATLIDALGLEKFSRIINSWFLYVIKSRKNEKRKTRRPGSCTILLNPCNLNMLKGLVWMCGCYPEKNTLRNIASLADALLRRNNRKMYTISALINACLHTLSRTESIDGISYLSDLSHRMKEPEIQSLIQQYLQEAAAARQLSIAELLDLSVQDFGLQDGQLDFIFGSFRGSLRIEGKAHLKRSWIDEAGGHQKHVPEIVKLEYKSGLHELLATEKEISNALKYVNERFDRMFTSQRILSWTQFEEYYLSHGLVSYFSKRLIWCFQSEGKTDVVIHFDGNWVNTKGNNVNPETSTMVCLWHPLNSPVEEIIDWRKFLLRNKIVQPVKQAFREVYLVAPEELLTRFYSNRMAAHLIRQQQFKMLANMKGWSYTPFGSDHDGRYKEMAVLRMPDYHLKAEFCINEPTKENEAQGKRMWMYVGTDQVRFFNQHGERMQLNQVPKIAFSEVMRDIQFFINETAVGKDLEWQDGLGTRAYKKNWQSYYFPEMTEMIGPKRKVILEGIIPRLKEKEVMELKENALVVKGKLRTYYIDLKTTRIQMSPYNQSLCIQPVVSPKADAKVYLPFNGDYGISLILSQALLLAEDDKITDPVINRQIKIR
jgi:hypothetical protein